MLQFVTNLTLFGYSVKNGPCIYLPYSINQFSCYKSMPHIFTLSIRPTSYRPSCNMKAETKSQLQVDIQQCNHRYYIILLKKKSLKSNNISFSLHKQSHNGSPCTFDNENTPSLTCSHWYNHTNRAVSNLITKHIFSPLHMSKLPCLSKLSYTFSENFTLT